MKYAALFIREDSAYKKRPEWDCYDKSRDALTFDGGIPCVCHPPCRAWGVMSHMAFRNKDWTKDKSDEEIAEKRLALDAIAFVQENGGILEHPAGSKLFGYQLPEEGEFPDHSGGITIEIDQFDFGHVAHKPTKLYICGVDISDLPALPPKRMEYTDRSIAGNVPGTKRCTQYQREYTPEALIDWFELVLDKIKENI